eukprot:c11995_g1_i2.p1 GENE.c11995_g1_i2~~c11995_g1_i2.p1  ORF type:complete len:209 (+),score=43.35 c11995_g1_i2:38-664(+)
MADITLAPSANREDAQLCIQKARDCLARSSNTEAIRFLEKSLRMFETQEARDLLQVARSNQSQYTSSYYHSNATSSASTSSSASTTATAPPTQPLQPAIVWYKPWTLILPQYRLPLLLMFFLIVYLLSLRLSSVGEVPPNNSYAFSKSNMPKSRQSGSWSFGFFPLGMIGGFGFGFPAVFVGGQDFFSSIVSSILLSALLYRLGNNRR